MNKYANVKVVAFEGKQLRCIDYAEPLRPMEEYFCVEDLFEAFIWTTFEKRVLEKDMPAYIEVLQATQKKPIRFLRIKDFLDFANIHYPVLHISFREFMATCKDLERKLLSGFYQLWEYHKPAQAMTFGLQKRSADEKEAFNIGSAIPIDDICAYIKESGINKDWEAKDHDLVYSILLKESTGGKISNRELMHSLLPFDYIVRRTIPVDPHSLKMARTTLRGFFEEKGIKTTFRSHLEKKVFKQHLLDGKLIFDCFVHCQPFDVT